MEDHRKIHPTPVATDAEAPSTVPLMPRPRSLESEKRDVATDRPQHPPTLSRDPKPRPRMRKCCCRCICWSICMLVLLVIAFAVSCGALYLVFKPKIPQYSVNSLKIANLRLNFDASLYAQFDMRIKAYNPNRKIGIYYEKGGRLSVWYKSTRLCGGRLPRFYQGHMNTTVMAVELSGETQYGRALLMALQEQQQTRNIPLDLKVDVPVAIKLGRLKLRKVRFLVGCKLVVDSLSANRLISIRTMRFLKYTIGVRIHD